MYDQRRTQREEPWILPRALRALAQSVSAKPNQFPLTSSPGREPAGPPREGHTCARKAAAECISPGRSCLVLLSLLFRADGAERVCAYQTQEEPRSRFGILQASQKTRLIEDRLTTAFIAGKQKTLRQCRPIEMSDAQMNTRTSPAFYAGWRCVLRAGVCTPGEDANDICAPICDKATLLISFFACFFLTGQRRPYVCHTRSDSTVFCICNMLQFLIDEI